MRVKGVDVFDPNTGDIRSDDTDGIAAWFIDTDYDEESFFVRHAYFLGANDPYKSLKTALQRRDRRGRLGDALPRRVPPVPAARDGAHRRQGDQPLRRRGDEGVPGVITRGLIIRPPWIDLILGGTKAWEMRSRPTNVRGPIALIRQGSGAAVGTADLVDCGAPLSRADYMLFQREHAIPDAQLDEVLDRGWVHPWVLANVRPFRTAVPIASKSGPVIFVTLDAAASAAIAERLAGSPDGAEPPSSDRRPLAAARSPTEDEVPDPMPAPSDAPTFVFRPEAAQARGRLDPDGPHFVVLAGSTAMRNGSPNVKRELSDRDALVRDGVLVPDRDPRLYRFAVDHRFSSPSKAAGVIKDGNASGPGLWLDEETGTTLRDHLARAVQADVPAPLLTERFDDALAFASALHRHQRRKGTAVPYVSHLMAVSGLVIEHGGTEDQAIAALLHDAAEDQGGEPTLRLIRDRYGDAVARIVADCTDAWTEPKPPWRRRKEDYIAALDGKPPSSLLVSLADKVHNARSIAADHAVLGDALWPRFTGGRDGTLWYYRALAEAFARLLPGRLAEELRASAAGMG